MPRLKKSGDEVVAPVFGESELILPEYFVMPYGKQGKYKLVNPTSQERGLSTRGKKKALKLTRKPVKNAVLVEDMSDPIPLELFSKKDRAIIRNHYKLVKQYESRPAKDVPQLHHTKPKERGRPETLPKNIAVNKARKEPPAPTPKKRGRPTKYQSEEEKKQKKREQTLASNKRKREERKKAKEAEAEGGNLITDVIRNVKNYGITKGFTETIRDKTHQAKAVITGNITQLSPRLKEMLKQYGSSTIKGISIRRSPVSGLLTGALSFFSGGKFGERQREREFDELFHLFMVFNLNDGKQMLLEKNERINMELNPKKRPKTEEEIVRVFPIDTLDLNGVLGKTKAYMGDKKFFGYSAKDNNCQDFILAVMNANDIGDAKDRKFVKQDTKELFRDLPYLRKLSNTLTNIGARANVFMEGGDIHQQYKDEVQALLNKKMNASIKGRKMNELTDKYKMLCYSNMEGKGLHSEYASDDEEIEGDGMEDSIDFDDIKWGSFTKQYERFKNQHKNSNIKDLEDFARMLLKDPSKYNKTTIKRARFYLNVLLPKKNKISGNSINMVKKLTKKQMKALEKETAGQGIYLSGVGGDGLYAGTGEGLYAGEGMYAGSGCSICGSGMEGGAIYHPILAEIDGGNIFKKAGRWFKKAGSDISKGFSKGGVMEQVGRQAFRQAVPTLTGALGGLAGSYGGPVGSLAGSYAGSKAGDEIVKMSGVGAKKRGQSAWIQEVKAIQQKEGISYKDALKKASAMRKKN